MQLFYTPGACSMSPHIVLEEAGLPYTAEKVDLASKKTEKGGDFTKVNPKGMVPTLVLDDGAVLTEGPAIVQYIADKAPGKKLIPPVGSVERYRVAEWLNFISTELHKQYTPLFRPNTPDDYKPIATETLLKNLGYVNQHLRGKHYLVGNDFTVADAYLFVVLSWAPYVKLDLSSMSELQAFSGRIAQRPAVTTTLKAEGLMK